MKRSLKKKSFEIFMYGLIYLFSFLTLASLVWIISYILIQGMPYITWNFLTTSYSTTSTGILPMIITTIYMIIISILIAAPIGIFAAIYLTEYAKQGLLVHLIRFTTETLAAIPSIVYGLFGLVFFVTTLNMHFSIIAAALTLSIMILPTIIRTTEEAIKAVPISYKEGSFALGAGRLATLFRIIIPCSISGILTAIILSIGRIVGESAVVLFTAGTALAAANEISISSSSRSLTVHLYLLAKEGKPLSQTFATASVLIILVLIINFIATYFAQKLKKKATGSSI